MRSPDTCSSERLALLFRLETGSLSSQELLSSLSEARYTVFDEAGRSELLLGDALATTVDFLYAGLLLPAQKQVMSWTLSSHGYQ